MADEENTQQCTHQKTREITTAGYGKKVFCVYCNQEVKGKR